ncbi:isochorismatase family cysteine hydrolase [Mycobacterium sp.]|uniref:isochorismatase family cysteine hydrolase n=1 Tax=Mycobacterium sp. TaxID=1785 RepID=UPI00260190E9|nr:isochorismatase family cysteine hydrolase [Mycobacterium sp.]
MRQHPFQMPDYVVERVLAKRGRLRVFDRFDPSTTALVVIDMQRFYVEEVETARGIVPTINRLAAVVRDRGGLVAWPCMTAGRDGESLWPVYHDHFFTPEKGARHRDELSEGAPGHELWPELDVQPAADLVVFKNRFSAFAAGSTLDALLRARGIENVVICGTATNFCSETSARDAMMLDYRVVMVSDANAARYDEDHVVGLTTVFQSFGDVLTADQVLDDLLR